MQFPPATRNCFKRGRGSLLRAFSLIEVLVVICIMALLFVLVLPVMKNAQKRANEAKCLNSLSYLHHLWTAYAQERNGALLMGNGNMVQGTATPMMWEYALFWEVVWGHDPQAQLPAPTSRTYRPGWQCPNIPGRTGYWRDSTYAYNECLGMQYNEYDESGNYAYDENGNIRKRNVILTLGNLSQASRTPVFADGGKRYEGDWGDPNYPNLGINYIFAGVQRYPDENGFQNIGYKYHNGSANFVFADGHIETLSAEEATSRAQNGSMVLDPRAGN